MWILKNPIFGESDLFGDMKSLFEATDYTAEEDLV